MTSISRRVVACVAAVLAATTSYAGQRILDLSSASGTKVSATATPGEVVTFMLVNKLPKAAYTITVEERVIPVPEFPVPSDQSIRSAPRSEACQQILDDAANLGKAANEAEVGEIVRRVRTSMTVGGCKTPEYLTKINEWLAQTMHIIPDQFVVRSGIEIVLIVTRQERVWTMVVSGGERGTWLTTYGVSIVPSQDKPYFAKALDIGRFKVTAEEEVSDARLIPSVFFSWLPRKRMVGGFSFGPTAGLGLGKARPVVFGGVGFTFNWNLTFIAGVAVSPHTRLRGRYGDGEELAESLSDDQLNRDVYRPTWLVATTFRFGSNPFGSGGDDTSSVDEKAAKKAATAWTASQKKGGR